MKKPVILALTLVAFATSPAFASKKSFELTCSNAETVDPENGTFTLTIDAEKNEVYLADGGELSASYKADSAKDTAGYAAFKIVSKDQDGEQPAEVKVSKDLITGKSKQAPIWVAPGIVGGSYSCTRE